MSAAVQDRALLAYTALLLLVTVVGAWVVPVTTPGGTLISLAVLAPWLAWVVLHSVVARGAPLTAQFLLIAGGVAFAIHAAAVNLSDAVDHTLQPQVLGVPVQVVGACLVYWYAGFAVTSALADAGPAWQSALPFCVMGALVTTALDLAAEPVAVRMGYFAYDHGGAFMPEVEGATGAHGIPLLHYLGWMVAAFAVYVGCWLGSRRAPDSAPRGRLAALLFYLSLFLATAIPAARLGYPQLLLIGGLPVALVSLWTVHHLIADRSARELAARRGKERARVTNLAERRLAVHRR
jgi:carotenoid biosynthesis protein